MMSRAARAAVLPGVLSLLLLSAPAATAQNLAVEDPAGDAPAGELDITRATVANRDHRVVARVTMSDLTRGDVIVSVDRRRGSGVRLVSTRRGDGTVTGRLLPGAFTDTADERIEPVTACRHYRVSWNDETETVRLSMPSRCWTHGDYGAVRFAVLTERHGADSDGAPANEDGTIGSSEWVPRG